MWVPLFYSLSKWPFSACDLYRNDFRSIYKLKTIYIQNENDLYIYRKQFVYRSLSSLPKVIFRLEKVRILNFSTSMSTSFHPLIWNHSKLVFVVENFFGACFNLSSMCLYTVVSSLLRILSIRPLKAF
ncbi:hypothetical protein CLI75_04335 [Porphyromonas gingivalis]|nr:hypothetical protein CLI75_04335 [Porphyromonas gingivalis]